MGQAVVGYFGKDVLISSDTASHVVDFQTVTLPQLQVFEVPLAFRITRTALLHAHPNRKLNVQIKSFRHDMVAAMHGALRRATSPNATEGEVDASLRFFCKVCAQALQTAKRWQKKSRKSAEQVGVLERHVELVVHARGLGRASF